MTQRWHRQFAVAPACCDAADVKAATQGGLHDDARCAAIGDLRHRFPMEGGLDRIHDVIFPWEAAQLKLGEDQLPIDLDLKAA